MTRLAVPFLLLALTSPLFAQSPLAELQKRFAAEAQKLDQSRPSAEQREALLQQQVAQLLKFVGDDAKGDDRWNGRLMLADLHLFLGERAKAAAALQGIDTKEAPALALIAAAFTAQRLNLKTERAAWIDAALAKPAPQSDQLAMARLLSTVLHEVPRGDAMFDAALAAAKDDEQRALVRWHRADAKRDREDLPDNAAYEDLETLAKELPATYWGGVAKDRLRATQLKPGDAAIAFTAKTRAGATWSLAEQNGKAVVLAFFTLADHDTPALVSLLQEQQKQHGANLSVVGICLDRDAAAIAAGVPALGIEFPVIGDGQGTQTDAALRWFAEGPVVHVIDATGKLAARDQHAGTKDARDELQAAIAAAVKAK